MHKKLSMRPSPFLVILGSCLIFICFCAELVRASEYENFKGIWHSNGYGHILDIGPDGVKAHDFTEISCVENPEMTDIFATYLVKGKVRFSSDRTKLFLSLPLEQYEYEFVQKAYLPKLCTEPSEVDSDFSRNFDVFVAYFSEHYASFAAHDVDWAARVSAARSKLKNVTSEVELFALFKDMLRGLRDPHVQIQAYIDGEDFYYVGYESETVRSLQADESLDEGEAMEAFLGQYWLDNIAVKILGEEGKVDANGYIQYGVISDVGYVAILAEGDYAGQGAFHDQEDFDKLNQVLNAAHELFTEKQVKGVILDLSVNFGGYEFISRAIAARFAAQDYFTYTRGAADTKGGAGQKIFIKPDGKSSFLWPTYVLTTDMTVSAGEVVALALKGQENIFLVGEGTPGAFSDALAKRLPNGWLISLSNEIMTDPEGVSYEAKGISPQMPLRVFDQPDPLLGHFNAVKYLIEMIGKDGL